MIVIFALLLSLFWSMPLAAATLTHHWAMDENTGTTAADGPGTADCTFTNNPAWSAPGKVGASALDFEVADNDLLSCGSTLLSSSNDWSIAAWINRESSGAAHTIIISGNTSAGNEAGQYLAIHSTNVLRAAATVGTNSQETADSSATISTGVWTHVAATKSGTTLTVYINGIANGTPTTLSSSTMDYATDTNTVNIASSFPTGSLFDGIIDEVKFWDGALTAAEVAAEAGVRKRVIPIIIQ